MNRLPDIDLPENLPSAEIKAIDTLEEDLKIIGEGEVLTEDLKADPFIRAEAFKPEKPQPRKKKAVSEKQKAHLANARKLAKERKDEAKKEKERERLNKKEQAEREANEKASLDNEEQEEQEYMKWLDKMDKYNKMTALLKKQEEEKMALILKKEQEQEARYFKKFQQQQQLAKLEHAEKTKSKPLPSILEQQEDDFGKYSKYF
jgi:hypothetical protein